MKGYKAFGKGLICKGFQYKEGETYETDKAIVCREGFHMCENPLDVLDYYDLCDSEFAEVEALGEIAKHDEDSKISTTKIKIDAKLSFKGFVEASVSFLLNICKPKKGHYSQLASSGDSSKLASSGDSSKLASSGDSSQLAMDGEGSVGAAIGINNKIKGKVGCWITLAEWKYDNNKNRYVPVYVKSAQIDGKKIKADTWYKLENKKFVEVEA